MSYFLNGIIYIIVPTADVTNDMLNNMKESFYATAGACRENNDGSKCVFKVRNPISTAFNGYPWFNETDIRTELEKPEWIPSV